MIKHMTPEELNNQVLLSKRPESCVYQAQNPTGELVVYKQFLFQQAQSWKQYELFEREAEALAALKHPQIPQLLSHGSNDSGPWLINQWMPGDTLTDKLAVGWHPTEAEIRRILEQSLEILDWLHERHPPIVHRDIKPSNLVISDDGKVSLIDFGSVLLKWQKDGGSTVAGTFGYMAPEQLTGRSSAASDLYSIGATAVRLLTGKEPTELPQERLMIRFEDHCQCSLQLKKIISKLLAPIPEDRFESAHQVLSTLRNALNVFPANVSSDTSLAWLQKLPDLPQSVSELKKIEVKQTAHEIQILLPAIGTNQVPLMGYAQYRLYFLAYIGPILGGMNLYRMSSPSLMAFFLACIALMLGLEAKCFYDYANTSTLLSLRDKELTIETRSGKKLREKTIERAEFKGAAAYSKNGKDIQLHIHALADKAKPEEISIGQKLSKEEQDWLCNLLFLWHSQGS